MSSSYCCFIEEAFVKPIRSVLIVDDDYPTYNEIIATKSSQPPDDVVNGDNSAEVTSKEMGDVRQRVRTPVPVGKKAWSENPEQFLKVIEQFRHPTQPLLVDIDDGTRASMNEEFATHMHQSDLLVLDFELDKGKRHDGTDAIKIVRRLMANQHFNLVIIYTKQELATVFYDVLIGTMCPLDPLSPTEEQRAVDLIEAAEQTTSFRSGSFEASVGEAQYALYRKDLEEKTGQLQREEGYLTRYYKIIEKLSWGESDSRLVLEYLLRQVEGKHQMNSDAHRSSGLRFSVDGEVMWIKAESVFLCFSRKSGSADDLLDALRAALFAWDPTPSRLFLTKLRAEMEESGIPFQDDALRRSRASAYWYYKLLKADESERHALIADTIERQTESLMDFVLPKVEDFGRRLLQAEIREADAVTSKMASDICSKRFETDWNPSTESFKQNALLNHNAFVCSKKAHGWHLRTGHIFLLKETYWVCLSPACDLVPSQSKTLPGEHSGRRLRFLAVELQKETHSKVPTNVHDNQHVFLNVNGEVQVFRFHGQSKTNSQPKWNFFFAENKGMFDHEGLKDGTRTFQLQQVEEGADGLTLRTGVALVVGQLRYEYALNLVQKMGAVLSRIGLGFADARAIQ